MSASLNFTGGFYRRLLLGLIKGYTRSVDDIAHMALLGLELLAMFGSQLL